jgi:hypothetical protein
VSLASAGDTSSIVQSANPTNTNLFFKRKALPKELFSVFIFSFFPLLNYLTLLSSLLARLPSQLLLTRIYAIADIAAIANIASNPGVFDVGVGVGAVSLDLGVDVGFTVGVAFTV